jgi:hypothetical protein
MRCWFHDWTRWTEPYDRMRLGITYFYQRRTCMRCKKSEERLV